jgi:hypothetical protein
VKPKLWIAWLVVLMPAAGMACEGNGRRLCEKQLAALVSYRTEAIDYAFGNVFAAMPAQIQIKFVRSDDPGYASLNGAIAYDREHATLIFPRRILSARLPNPLRWAAYYWPFYENERQRQEFPVIESIDNALWGAYLQEAAKARGLPWPHKDCQSVEVAKRLPCEMLAGGIAEHVKDKRQRIFNSNRVDRIWPEDFVSFQKRVWRTDLEYEEVLRYGGILLIRPLISEFGVPRTLTYIAQTPFQVEGNSLKAAALSYQEHAREALSKLPIAATSAASSVEAIKPAVVDAAE